MLKGDLGASSLAPVLIDLAGAEATGSVILNRPDGAEAQLFLRNGMICGVSAPDQRSDLGAKLISSGVLAPEALSDALEAQRTDLSAWNLGELLVHLGYVEEDVIQEFVIEQLHEALWDLMQWNEGRWKFRKNAKIREDIRPPQPVVALLETLRERGYEWEEISSVVNSPDAIPVLSARGDGAPETTLDSDAWSMLCKIDGVRSVAELANDCGYTLFEAGQVLVTLVDAGLVDISDEIDDDSADVYGASALAQALSGRSGGSAPATGAPADGDDALTRLARIASDVASHSTTAAAATNPLQLDVMAAQLNGASNLTVPVRRNGETFAASMGRVSGALADALGPVPEDQTDAAISLIEVRKRPKPAKEAAPIGGEQELERRRRLRAAAAAELADAQAAAEALRPDHDVNARTDVLDAPPKLVHLDTERARVAAREAEEASRHASEDAARKAAEEFAKAAADEAARHAAQMAEAQLVDAQHAEQQAQREAADQAAEQAAAEEAARQLAAEQAAAQLAAEQAAAEQAAAAQAAEQAAQAAAAQDAAERAAADSREAAARAEAEASLIAAQAQAAAADEAQRLAQEAQRVADEQAALAADTAAKHAAIDEHDFAAAAVLADQAAEASAMLAELNHTTSVDVEPMIAVVPDPEPDPEPALEHYAAEPDPPASMRPGSEGADTAALLRELSSLGVEDDDRSAMTNIAPRAPRPNHVDPKKAKKKIGLFGL